MRVIAGGLIILLVSLGVAGAGCVSTEAGTGTIEVLVTNTITEQEASEIPTEFEISSIKATVSEIKVYREEGSEQGEWLNLYVAEKPLDLLRSSGQEQFLAFVDVEASSYSQILLVIDKLDVTLNDGSEMVIVPSEPFDFVGPFVVIAGETTAMLFNFEIDKSVVIEEDKATIKPLASITLNVRYEESGTEAGTE